MYAATITFRDNKGKLTSRTIYGAGTELTPGVPDVATDDAEISGIAAEMAALSDAELARVEVSYLLSESNVVPAGNVNFAQIGAFGVRNDAGTLSRITVPALIDAAVQPDSDLLDQAHGGVAAMIARLESGDVVDYRGAVLETVEYAREEHTRRG